MLASDAKAGVLCARANRQKNDTNAVAGVDGQTSFSYPPLARQIQLISIFTMNMQLWERGIHPCFLRRLGRRGNVNVISEIRCYWHLWTVWRTLFCFGNRENVTLCKSCVNSNTNSLLELLFNAKGLRLVDAEIDVGKDDNYPARETLRARG